MSRAWNADQAGSTYERSVCSWVKITRSYAWLDCQTWQTHLFEKFTRCAKVYGLFSSSYSPVLIGWADERVTRIHVPGIGKNYKHSSYFLIPIHQENVSAKIFDDYLLNFLLSNHFGSLTGLNFKTSIYLGDFGERGTTSWKDVAWLSSNSGEEIYETRIQLSVQWQLIYQPG